MIQIQPVKAPSPDGYSYSAVRRILADIQAKTPPATTVRLYFAPGEAAQVDFGAGPFLFDPERQISSKKTE